MSLFSLEIPYRDPLCAVAPLAAEDNVVLLDAPVATDPRGRYGYVCAFPRAVRRLSVDKEVDPFAVLEALRPPKRAPVAGLPPFQTGVVAMLGYEVGGAVESLPVPAADDLGLPDLWAARYDTIAAFDTHARQAWVISAEGEAAARAFAARLGAPGAPLPGVSATPVPWQAERSRAAHETAVARAIAYIEAGDIFQANITQRILGRMPPEVSSFDLYRRLRTASPAPFAAWISLGNGAAIASASPERFLSLDGAGRVETRPIKGTAPRGATPEDDQANARHLLQSTKDRAENLMIVDLLRNDIGRVCAIGSVRVPALAMLESFASVHHLVSVVEGRLAPERTAVDLLRACFPGGSITGAPKVRAMEIIAELEASRRGPYCGSLAWIGADGAMDSSILIRSLCIGETGRVAAQAGGGIVADSIPAAEYEESLTKVRPLLQALAAGG